MNSSSLVGTEYLFFGHEYQEQTARILFDTDHMKRQFLRVGRRRVYIDPFGRQLFPSGRQSPGKRKGRLLFLLPRSPYAGGGLAFSGEIPRKRDFEILKAASLYTI